MTRIWLEHRSTTRNAAATAPARQPATAYHVLRVAYKDTAERVRAAYLELALRLHPDKRKGDDSGFREVTAAYAILKDSERRRAYNAKLLLEGRVCLTCNGTGTKKGFVAGQYATTTCLPCEGIGLL